MSTWKHIFCLIYGVSFASLFLIAGFNLIGAIAIEWKDFQTPIYIFGMSISAFLLSAIRTKDFWKDDPDSIRSLKKKIIESNQRNLNMTTEYGNREEQLKAELLKVEKERDDRIARPKGTRKPSGNF